MLCQTLSTNDLLLRKTGINGTRPGGWAADCLGGEGAHEAPPPGLQHTSHPERPSEQKHAAQPEATGGSRCLCGALSSASGRIHWAV